MTIYENNDCFWHGYLFVTASPPNTTCSLTISLPINTIVRNVFISTRDQYLSHGIGLIVSVGDTDVDKLNPSKRCTFTTNNGTISTSSVTGLSAWVTCNNIVGSNLFVTNPTLGHVILFEIMAFTQYNIMPFVYIVHGSGSTQPNTKENLKNTEFNF
jgi:hypothetical protein